MLQHGARQVNKCQPTQVHVGILDLPLRVLKSHRLKQWKDMSKPATLKDKPSGERKGSQKVGRLLL